MAIKIENKKTRTAQVRFVCFESEKNALKKLSEKTGVSQSHIIRNALKKIMPKDILI